MARMRTLGPGGEPEQEDPQGGPVGLQDDLSAPMPDIPGNAGEYAYDPQNPEWKGGQTLDYLLKTGMTEMEAGRNKTGPRGLAKEGDSGGAGPSLRKPPLAMGGGGAPEAENAPEQPMTPAPAQMSAFTPMQNPVSLRQMITPAMPAGGGGLFGKVGGLMGGGIDVGQRPGGAQDITALIRALLQMG